MVQAISFLRQNRHGRTQLGLHHRNRLIANTSLLEIDPFESQLEISIVLWDTFRPTRSVRTKRWVQMFPAEKYQSENQYRPDHPKWVQMFPAEKYQSENQYRPDCTMDSHSKDCHPKDCHPKDCHPKWVQMFPAEKYQSENQYRP